MSRRALLSADDTRDAVLAGAETLFRQVGYGKTTMADIAGAAAMSPANLYRFFPSKAAINDAIARRMLAGMHASMRALAAEPAPAPARLRRLIVQTHCLHRDLFLEERRVHDMVQAAMAENWDAIQDHIATCNTIAEGVIRDGIQTGDFAPGDPAALAATSMQACCAIFNPMMIALCLDQHAVAMDTRDAERIAWLVVTALTHPAPEVLP